MPAVFINCAVELEPGKKLLAKYKENAEYAYQSYHSTRLPMEPPMIDFILQEVFLLSANCRVCIIKKGSYCFYFVYVNANEYYF